MEMIINLNKLISEKNKRAWTQGHLAEVCGLSLRTIQRIEKTGVASHETIKALASVFEISIEELIYDETKDESIKKAPKFESLNVKVDNNANGGKYLVSLGFLLMIIIPGIWLFTLLTGTYLRFDVQEINGSMKTISSPSTLFLLFQYTHLAYFTLLPAIVIFAIAIGHYEYQSSWVKSSILFSSLLFLLSSTILAPIVFILVLILFYIKRKQVPLLRPKM